MVVNQLIKKLKDTIGMENCLEGEYNMHLSEIRHSKKNDCRLSRTQVIIVACTSGSVCRAILPTLVSQRKTITRLCSIISR